MSAELEQHFKSARTDFEKAIEHLQKELVKVRTGKASTSLVDGIQVQYYGSPVPLTQVANVGVADARTITIAPWEKKIIGDIEQAIFAANLGLTPQNDGEMIRITIPPLTEERRKDLVKQVKHYGEETKIALRNIRHKLMDLIKKEKTNGLSEDIAKSKETQAQNMLNDFVTKVDHVVETKDKELMTV
ncbi:MAG: ribosome recycling factor [Saprospiraceae bacterium]|nr:ribosome recycling factor [Saprospiraceae bacterium]